MILELDIEPTSVKGVWRYNKTTSNYIEYI